MYEKVVPFKLKAVGPSNDLGEGEFTGYASVFGNADHYGDIVDHGAFKRTLEEWKSAGQTIPVLWGHDKTDPFANIGGLDTAEEDDTGLRVSGKLDMDNPKAVQVYRLMKGRRTNSMSFAYSIQSAGEDDDGYHLKDLNLYEVSVVQIPANPEAQILTVKAQVDSLTKDSRVSLEKLREAHKALGEAIEAKAVPAFRDLPLSGRTATWDAASAEKRVRAWAGGADNIDDMDWLKYRRAFLWYDSDNSTQVSGYKLPFTDIIDSELTAVWGGITAAAAAVQGARGGVSLPTTDVPGVKNRIERYYAKARTKYQDDNLTAPWKKSAGGQEQASTSGSSNDQDPQGKSEESSASVTADAYLTLISTY